MEMRPARTRPCPMKDSHACEWNQITAWYMGRPDNVVDVKHEELVREAVEHMEKHYGPKRSWIV